MRARLRVAGVASITGKVDCGFVYVDGLAVGDVGEESLKDRRILGGEGCSEMTVVVRTVTGSSSPIRRATRSIRRSDGRSSP